jgi:hypothetical protein
MKKLYLFGVVVLFVCGVASSSFALTLGLSPSSQTILPGASTSVDITISGLGDGFAPSLGVFDLDVTFDDTILGFNSVTYGDPVLGDQLDLFGFGSWTETDASTAGSVNMFELSFDFAADLNDFQADSFILGTLFFDAVGIGTSLLELSVRDLGDAEGGALTVDEVNGASVNVAPVPEPSTFILLAFGLSGLAYMRKRRS